MFPKCIKTKERHSLAVCGSLCGEKLFLLIFIPFTWFEQIHLFKQILIFPGIFPFQTCSEKKLSEYFSARFWYSHILIKKGSSLWISPKMHHNKRKALFSSMWLTLWRKRVFVNIYPPLLVCSKTVV